MGTKTRTVSALVIRPDGTAAVEAVEADLFALQRLVGGDLELVRLAGRNGHAYVNAEGWEQCLPVNAAASAFARSLGAALAPAQDLVGPVVFLGLGPDGAEADVPPRVVGAAVRTWGGIA